MGDDNSNRLITHEELSKHDGAAPERGEAIWTAVDNVVYDITAWSKRHPGGKVIRLAMGRESATLVESYHPSGSAARVRNSLQACPIVGRMKGAFELAVTFTLYVIATYYVSVVGSVWAAVVLGFLTGRLGFIMHSGNHQAISRNVWWNKAGGLMMDLIGSTHLIWSFEHQVAHHMDPNVYKKDNDCEIGNPAIRFHPKIERKWWHRYNHIVTIAGMSIGFFKWYLSDPFHYYTQTVGNVHFNVTKRDWIGLAISKSVWFYLHVILPLQYHTPARTFGLLVLFMVLGGHYLENIFIVNHIQDELVPPADIHWANKQVIATANWGSASHFCNWISGGLNHQIEHHLFPSYSIYTYPVISPIVREVCAKHGLPYHNYSHFGSAWLAMVTYLKNLGTDKFDSPIMQAVAGQH